MRWAGLPSASLHYPAPPRLFPSIDRLRATAKSQRIDVSDLPGALGRHRRRITVAASPTDEDASWTRLLRLAEPVERLLQQIQEQSESEAGSLLEMGAEVRRA
jgi:hypothetical protein